MGVISWGIIGCGDVCERKSGPPLYELANSDLVGVHRRDEAKGRDFAQRHNDCSYFASAEDLLADPNIQAVYVATHPDSHEAYTVAAAAAGKHVLVEKEMAVDAAACSRMIEACAGAGVHLGVAFYRRCYPSMLKVKELLAAETIGSVTGLQINDQFPLSHRLDLAHFFLGPAATLSIAEEDLPAGSHAERGKVLRIRHEQGPEAVMNIGWHETHDIETVTLTGSTGSITVTDLKAGTMSLHRDGRKEAVDQDPLPWTHWGLMDNYNKFLLGEAELACPGTEGRQSQVIEDIVNATPADGQAVPVTYD